MDIEVFPRDIPSPYDECRCNKGMAWGGENPEKCSDCKGNYKKARLNEFGEMLLQFMRDNLPALLAEATEKSEHGEK